MGYHHCGGGGQGGRRGDLGVWPYCAAGPCGVRRVGGGERPGDAGRL